ncbi:MAG: radical SAM protein [Spirochaetes bacterium]|nr:radical SAM protein [Spirochaetota bacterium]
MKHKIEDKFNQIILKTFKNLVRLFLFQPKKIFFFCKTFLYQKKAAKKREIAAAKGEAAPAIMIFSITNRCNLKCAGCYNQHQHRNPEDKLSLNRISSLFQEAWHQGISITMLAGGEPFIRMDILKIAAEFPKMIFPVFTNGTLIKNHLAFLQNHPQILPIMSLEGDRVKTDTRRGKGLYDKTIETAIQLKKKKMFFGFSITLTRQNADEILTKDFIEPTLKLGAKAVFFVEYVPQNIDEEGFCLTDSQKQKLIKLQSDFEEKYPALFISLPGDEEYFGGCLAAGRGFIHVSAGGDVEPCPFAPYSTANINHYSLKEALATTFIKKIRDSHHLLTEAKGGCALWENKEWVEKQRIQCLDEKLEDVV